MFQNKPKKSYAHGMEPLIFQKNTIPSKWRQNFNSFQATEKRLEIYVEQHAETTVDKKSIVDVLRYLSRVREGRNHEKLQHFTLKTKGPCKVTDQEMKEIVQKVGRKYRCLKGLNLKVEKADNSTYQVVRELIIQVKTSFRTINSLALDLFISDASLQMLYTHMIPKLKPIKDFSLSLAKGFLETPTLNKLAEKIGRKLRLIKNLSLNFANCFQLGDQAIKILAIQIAPRLKNPQTLSLNFTGSDITDQGAKGLAILLSSNLKSLQGLSLDFTGCKQLVDPVEQVAMQIGMNLRNLKSLSLCFNDCRKIKGLSVGELCAQIALLKDLRNLSLEFKLCYDISDQLIIISTKQISSELTSLRRLKLVFEMSTETTNQLRDMFKAVPCLEF